MRTMPAVILLLLLGVAVPPAVERTPTGAIKVDQVGYLPRFPKLALVDAAGVGGGFVVRRESDDEIVVRASLGSAVTDATSGDVVRSADFSALVEEGRYYLEVDGVGTSWTFGIAHDIFERAYYLAARSYYGQRCGIDVDLGGEFPGFRHAACHLGGAYDPTSGRAGAKPSGNKGWHDAGDYGRYVVNSGISTGTLLWTYELFGRRVARVDLALPESRNGTPDLLDEIRWNLEWMLSMQDEDGGVYHKQTSATFCDFVMPERDTLTSVVVGTGQAPYKSSCATADFAAVMAIAARVYTPFDRAFADQARGAASKAFAWVAAHPAVTFANPNGIETGAYGDSDCSDEILWAAAELWRTTRVDAYRRHVVEHHAATLPQLTASTPPDWAKVGPLGLWTYALAGPDDGTARAIVAASAAAADRIAGRTAAAGYRHAMEDQNFVWGSNGVVANYGVQLLVADALAPNPRYREAAADQLHYLLGRNTFSMSFVTQVGANPVRHPHHRPSGADGNVEPWPGLLSGGPNRRRQDPAMRKLPDLPPARMFVDAQESYASNEVAINWNAPLVFLLAAQLPEAAR
jgi:endoglucanase